MDSGHGLSSKLSSTADYTCDLGQTNDPAWASISLSVKWGQERLLLVPGATWKILHLGLRGFGVCDTSTVSWGTQELKTSPVFPILVPRAWMCCFRTSCILIALKGGNESIKCSA